MAQDTRPSSSAPCHEAKKVSRIAMRVFSYIKDLHNELRYAYYHPWFVQMMPFVDI